MQTLTHGELTALRGLADRQAGNSTTFVRIAEAMALTELGFASRSRQGWDITAAGSACLNRLDVAANGVVRLF